MSENEQKKPSKFQRAARVASIVELTEVSLRRVDTTLHFDRDDVLKDGNWFVGHTHATEHRYDPEAHHLSVDVNFRMDVRTAPQEEEPASPPPGRSVMSFACGFRLEYDLKQDPDSEDREESLTAFAELNGLFNAWPYVRELVQSTTTRMSLPPLVLRVLRLSPSPPPPPKT
jgi:hypothetical protein